MFEKEGYKWTEKNISVGISMYNPSIEMYCGKAFKDGAEFGYNKANEWHFVKDGLPEKTGRYLILNRFGDHYFTTNIANYLEGAKVFSTFPMECVIAWKEIVLPNIKESE